MSNDTEAYKLAAVRDLLLAAFTADTFRQFFLYVEHPALRPIRNQLASGDGLEAMVAKTLTHCEKRAALPALLAEVQQANPEQYARFASRLGVPSDLDSRADRETRAAYLAVLRERYSKAHSGAFVEVIARDARVGSVRRLDLLGKQGVYVPLLLDPLDAGRGARGARPGLPDEGAMERQQPQSWAEVLSTPGHLAVIGRAGCGKTTLLRVLAAVLAAERPEAAMPDLARALPAARPLPIFLPLRAFEYACTRGDYCRDLQHLLRFVEDWTARWTALPAWPVGFLERHIRQGRAWLLLDALDEVADADHRRTVRNILGALADLVQDSGTRLVVTARVAAYGAARLDDRFALFQVRDLDDEQRAAMAHAIYRGLDVPNADGNAAYLEERIRQSEALHALVRTPVMLWTAAVVHTLRGKLPESRAALYTAYVDILLRHSHSQQEGDVDELAPVVGSQFSLAERHEYLTYAAFEAHRRLESRAEERAADRPAIPGHELVDEILGPYLERFDDPETARTKARRYLTLMVEHSGLLVETDAGYAFGDHLTMQEFLAGCYLGIKFNRHKDLLGTLVQRSWWKEVLLFAVGYLAEDRDRSSETPDLLQLLAGEPQAPPERRLVHLTLAGEALLQLRARVQRPSWYGRLAQRFADALYALLYATRLDAPPAARQEAGLAVGLLYGYPGQEGGLADPRFAHPGGLPDFVPIEAGPFWMGEDDSPEKDERPRHRVHLGAYELARFPTTNAMYARFIDAGGYADRRWWAAAIADGHWDEESGFRWGNLPRDWDSVRFNNPSQPVVSISWYEAVAYCAWLTAAQNDGYTYRLPTEAEWERMARGSQGWRYPWGDEWRNDHCNSEEAGLERTSPVGLFPRGAAEGGPEDMAGNVWEWCSSRWGGYDSEPKFGYPYRADDGREEPGEDSRILRGGSWWNEGPSACRCGCRLWINPWTWINSWGFRCARASSSVP